ncbi:MAG: DUF983 domain-containing protein [Chloroflexi bacterium]|nr:DUF983 domain-containing protein [Chloroflexota bacterium]MBP8058525.1 DUF983 domain-containing protein [Chloroflexota bacterium]
MRLKALLQLRCPHCLQGKIFYRLLKMHEQCPVCGIKYEREEGYFMMSIFIGYLLGTAAAIPPIAILIWLQASLLWHVITISILLILLSPFIFRYARGIWLHIDELLDPHR